MFNAKKQSSNKIALIKGQKWKKKKKHTCAFAALQVSTRGNYEVEEQILL